MASHEGDAKAIGARTPWDLSCPNWADRLRTGRSLVPDLPLDLVQGERAVRVFNKLRLADVPGTPTMEDAAGEWFRDIVRALFGSLDANTRERMIRELFLLVPKKNSKALALDTPIATPDGFTTMGRVQVGDIVIDADGRPTRVTEKSQVFIGRECFEVEFSTGETVICDADHLWVTDAHTDRARQKYARKGKDFRKHPCPTVKTTREIATTLTVKSGEYFINNHRTVLCGPLDLAELRLPIPPYALGAWLGDGTSTCAAITTALCEADAMAERLVSNGQPAYVRARFAAKGSATIALIDRAIVNGPDRHDGRFIVRNDGQYRFGAEARKLGLIGNKHIPTVYLRASRDQRLALLRGLMDTDGSISKAGQASYSTTLSRLRDDVVELINSLGFKASYSEHRARVNGKDCGACWRVQFWPFDAPVFSMHRKLERQKVANRRNAARSRTRQIVAVRAVQSTPTQCIAVESASHQFLVTRSLIPTHNTTNGALLMVTALLLNERPHAPLIMTAPVQDVAQLAFDAAAGAIRLDPVLDKKLHIREHLKTIIHRETKAELQIMTFDPAVLTGQKPVYALVDELHVVANMSKAPSAIRQLRGGMLPYPEGFLAFITTQSEEAPAGVFQAELMKARAIRDGRQEGAMLPVLYEFPEAMQKDSAQWQDPANWHMVTPNAGRSISIPRLVQEFETAKNTSEAELRGWASQHLNVEIGLALHANSWPGSLFWEQQSSRGLQLVDLFKRCEVITAGIDGGGLDDLLALSFVGRETDTGDWLHWSHAWMHPIVLERRKSEAQRFEDFARDGDLTIVEHIGDDLEELADYVEQCEKSQLLDNIGVDAAGIGAIVDAIVARKVQHERIIGIPQGWKLVGAIKTTERRLAEGAMHHGGSRMMTWCVGNARVEPRGNAVLITKQTSGAAKIDPLMATFNAVALMAQNPKPRKKRYQLMVF